MNRKKSGPGSPTIFQHMTICPTLSNISPQHSFPSGFFHIPLTDNIVVFFLVFLVIVVIMMLLSLALHGFFKNSRQVMPFTILGFQYVLFASGMIIPVEQMPGALKYIVYINPVYHMNQILVRIWYHLSPDIVNVLALAAWTAVCLILIRLQKGFATDK